MALMNADSVVCAAVPVRPAESTGQQSPGRGGAHTAIRQHPRHCTSALNAVGSSHVSGAGEGAKHTELDRPHGHAAGVQYGELFMIYIYRYICIILTSMCNRGWL